jgi:hypothetical protein
MKKNGMKSNFKRYSVAKLKKCKKGKNKKVRHTLKNNEVFFAKNAVAQ